MPAIEAANAAVRKNPADLGSRILLAELLAVHRQLSRRARRHSRCRPHRPDPTSLIAVAEFRQIAARPKSPAASTAREGRVAPNSSASPAKR